MAIGTFRLADMRENIRQSWEDFHGAESPQAARLLPWEEVLVERFIPPGAQVLVIGCGGGRDLAALAERGCQVTGVEPSDSAISQAQRMLREQHVPATLVKGFFEDVPVPGAFDAVIFSYYCYAFIPVSRRRTDALRKAAALLKPGGYVLVSRASGTVRPRAALIRIARTVGALCGSDWRLEPGDVIWENRRRRPSYSFTHAFAVGELEREAAAAGLTTVCQEATADGTVITVFGGS
jgi:SAM-dependent methyltransferase